ncbi:hypothetical protein ACFP2T_20090 [Plantactinospora solaniradicis]|uniref:DUF3618 domain-containing protein n=1 Tax=Plantactinospora solaniradicis TaxID=1723736 RepID=A0ABW1KCI3_9ACTN
MSGDMAAVVAQLLAVRDNLANAVVTALRAKAEADEAHLRYEEASKGTNHRDIRAAVVEARTASDKSAKIARLLNESQKYLVKYINTIAPGSATEIPDVMPSGERLVREAADQESRAARYHTKATQAAANHEEGAKKIEATAREAISIVKDRIRPGDAQASTGTPSHPPPSPPQTAKSGHPIADAVLAVAGIALAARVAVQSARKRRERKRSNEDQATDS